MMKRAFSVISIMIIAALLFCSCGKDASAGKAEASQNSQAVTLGNLQDDAPDEMNTTELFSVEDGPDDNEKDLSDTAGTDTLEDSESSMSELDMIEEMVICHGNYGDEADEKVKRLLNELSAMNPEKGEKWSRIMKLWKSLETDPGINYDVLPDGLTDTDELAIVVLGFKLLPDGSMQEELIERLNVAKRSAEKYPNAFIVTTGGGTASLDFSATEAGKMAEWLIDNGIDESRVIVEDTSITTSQNAINTCRILMDEHPQVRQIAVISSDYHIATGALVFAAEGILLAEQSGKPAFEVVSNAAWEAPSGYLSSMFQAGALIELAGDVQTAFSLYHDTYDVKELPD